MTHYTEKAKELRAQFGDNAKYVVCEIVDALKITTLHLTINRTLERQKIHNDFIYWKDVKNELEKPQFTASKSCTDTCEKWQTVLQPNDALFHPIRLPDLTDYCKCTPDETTGWIKDPGDVEKCNICGKPVNMQELEKRIIH